MKILKRYIEFLQKKNRPPIRIVGKFSLSRRSLCLIVGILLLLSSLPSLAQAASLYIYVPSNAKVRKLIPPFKQAFATHDIQVFGRIRDFEGAIKKEPPHAILTYRNIINDQSVFAPSVQGKKGSADYEQFVVLTLTAKVSPDKLPSMSLAVLDILGRKRMKGFVAKLLGVSKSPKLKRVKRMDDLLSTLLLNMADGILVPQSLVEDINKKAGTNLIVTKFDQAKVLLPALGFSAAASEADKASMEKALMQLPAKLNREMRVDSWSR